jgi:hypothetical protein
MNKFLLTIQGYTACFSWIVVALWEWLLEYAPDLRFWKWHTNIDDHLWYAERVNGRLAMLALTFLFIWYLTHGHKFDTILLGV